MGISGLLSFLKPITKKTTLSRHKGQAAAIDTFCLLHKAAVFCAEELVTGSETTRYIDICIQYYEVFRKNDIRPLFVFDGLKNPLKENVDTARERNRQEFRLKALAAKEQGDPDAESLFKKAVTITYEMVVNVIKELRKRKIDYLIAPFEADAQLAYLCREGFVDFVVSEDSDLLAFGCPKVIFKLDLNGNGDVIYMGDVNEFTGFNHSKFLHICILAGCDYLPSVKGVGLHSAKKVINASEVQGISWGITNLVQILKKTNLVVPGNYLENFRKAENGFLYQCVFNPRTSTAVPLNECDNQNKWSLWAISEDLAMNIAIGNINTDTKEKVMNFDIPDKKAPLFVAAQEQNSQELSSDEEYTPPNNEKSDTTAPRVRVQQGSLIEVTRLVEEVSWTIPSFPVLTVTFKKAEAKVDGQKQTIFLNCEEATEKLKVFPVELTTQCDSMCQIDFHGTTMLVIWKLELSVLPGLPQNYEEELLSDGSWTTSCSTCSSEDSSEDESEEEEVEGHTLPFKVMGTNRNKEYHEHLKKGYDLKERQVPLDEFKVELSPEPDNLFDENAIAVKLDFGNGMKVVGYIVKELTKYIHPLIKDNKITRLCVGDIRYRIDCAIVGYYMKLEITRKGVWERAVIRASMHV